MRYLIVFAMLNAAPAMAQVVGTFGACMLETGMGEPINAGPCEAKPPNCNPETCEITFHWQKDDFNTVVTTQTARGFPGDAFMMNGQDAYQPVGLQSSDPRDCIYNTVTDSIFCFISTVDAHLIAGDGVSAWNDLLAEVGPPDGTPSNDDLLAPFQGRYRYNDSWDCVNVGSDRGAIAIMGDTLYSVETTCDLTQGELLGPSGAVSFVALCEGEGDTWSDQYIMRRYEWGALGIMHSAGTSVWDICN